MKTETVNYGRLGESMHVYRHSSGLNAFVIPKKGYLKKHATFATHYGSIDSEFKAPGDSEPTRVADGIAHFLEHKLFEQKDGSVMDKFTQLGASPNAYTGFTQTVYLFSCTDRFTDNFKLLLNFVQNPYITDESVEKEKGIIGQEISMYQDDPGWRAYFNLMGAFYKNNPVKLEIAGTHESIAKIDKESLYKCYNTFYHPSNMVICVVGDVDHESVFEEVERSINVPENKGDIVRIFPPEPKEVNERYVEQKMAVSMPMFQMGFKDNRLEASGFEGLKHDAGIRILLDMIIGRSSELYEQLYNEGLINSTFEFDFTMENTFAFSMLGGETTDPLAVKDKFSNALEKIKKNGLDRRNFDRIRKAHFGRFLRQLNSIEAISHAFISIYFKGVSLFDYLEVYDKINYEYAVNLFQEHFNTDYLSLSVIKPV